jgi:hypothetical protein
MYFKKTVLTSILVASLFVAGCARRPEIGSYVPENAAFFVEITDAATFFADADGFVKELGIKALLQNQGLMEFMDGQLKAALQGFSLSSLDLTKPVGLAMILAGAGQSRPTTILYLPLKNPEKDGAEMEKAAAALGFGKTAKAGSYGILYEAANDLKFPPEKSLDLSGLDKYKSGCLSYFVNVKGLLSQYGAGLDAAVTASLEKLQSAEAGMDRGPRAMMKGTAAAAVDAVRQIESFDGSVKLSQEGLVTRSSLGFAKGKGLAAFMRALASSKNPGPFVKYLPRDHLFSMAADFDPKAQKLAADFLVDFLVASYGLSPEETEYYRGLMKSMLAQVGSKAALGLDLEMDFRKLSAMGTLSADVEEAAERLKDAVGIRGVGAYGVKNGPAYLAFMRSMYEDPRFRAVMNKSAAASGMKVDTMIKDAKEGDLSYQSYTIIFEPASSANRRAPMSQGLLDALSEIMRMCLAAGKDRIYMGMGKDGPPTLSAVVKADANPEDLSKDPGYAAFVKLAGGDGQLIARLSTNRLLSLVSGAAGMASGRPMNLSIPEEASTGMWTVFRASGDTLQSVGFWGAREIGAIVQQVGIIMAQSFMR